jgi:hypothetical protein
MIDIRKRYPYINIRINLDLLRLSDYSAHGFKDFQRAIAYFQGRILKPKKGSMTKGTFKKIGKSKQRMYGARGILACGYLPGEQSSLLSLLEQNGFKDMPVIFVTDHDSAKTLKELLASEDRAGLGERSEMKRAIIMSGFTQKELYRLMAIYRLSEFPTPLWASLTPISETWTISHLLNELAAEAEAMKKRKEGVKDYVHTSE